jgi:hypothetical protein
MNEGLLPLVDDQLHDILLGVFSHRVDPIIGILHWPTFLERCRVFRRRTCPPAQVPAVPNYPSAYPPGTSYDSPHSIPFANPATMQSDSEPPTSSTTDATFLTLLYSVYFASLVSIIHSPTPPELGQNVNPVTLWNAFKREVTTRISKLDGKLARAESIEMLQAMVLYMVSPSLDPTLFDANTEKSVELGTTDCQLQWLQLGTAIRMAQSSGVHRDPSNFGFDPIEIETRRRLWAQICTLDTRLAEQLCREPTITPDSYDIILPLSISDQELADIDRRTVASRHGQVAHFKSLDKVEQDQQQLSPFSSVTLMLIESEVARQQQQLLCFRYQPRDRPLAGTSSSPQLARRATPFGGRPGRTSWAGELQERYSSRYQWDRLDSSDPMQYLVSEMCQINILKATFISRLAQRKETSGPVSTPSGHSEAVRYVFPIFISSSKYSVIYVLLHIPYPVRVLVSHKVIIDPCSIFHDALQLATRCAALSHQYSASPYYWYTRRIREASSCSFLALVLASDLPISHEATNTAWAVLDQLFVPDNNGQIIEPGLKSSLIGKVLVKARIKRGLQSQATRQFREQPIGTAAGGYQMHIAQYPPVSSTTNMGHPAPFQPSGNLFEDWDAIMQEPIWHGGGVSAADNSYWV